MPVPQLKLGPNGEMILDEQSLTIEMTGEKEARERIANGEIIYDDLHSSRLSIFCFINSKVTVINFYLF